MLSINIFGFVKGHLVKEMRRKNEFDASLRDEIDGPGKSYKVDGVNIQSKLCFLSIFSYQKLYDGA